MTLTASAALPPIFIISIPIWLHLVFSDATAPWPRDPAVFPRSTCAACAIIGSHDQRTVGRGEGFMEDPGTIDKEVVLHLGAWAKIVQVSIISGKEIAEIGDKMDLSPISQSIVDGLALLQS